MAKRKGAAPSPSSSSSAQISSAPKSAQISISSPLLYIVCLFCFWPRSKDNEVDTLPPFVIRNLANPVEKPNFRLNNHNWQLWQTNSSQGRIKMEQYLPHELHDVSEETAYDSYYSEYTTPDSMDCGSTNLLVTFDYGYSDSIEARADPAGQDDDRGEGADPEYGEGYVDVDADAEGAIWFGTPPKEKKESKLFEVHHVQHKLLDESLQSLISYDVDDFEEELSDPEPDEEIFYDSIECV
uniref:Uncharacterized protein LOC108043121 n=1 Tax=Drosophila rhopaloa TaxID=1041015 RepID=A0A6P4EQ54_DRORH